MGAAEGWYLTMGSRRIELPAGEHVVGRSRDCDVVVRDPTVSRGHALVAVERDRVTVQDLGSSNGVVVNGQRVREEIELAAGDQLRLGRVRMTLDRGVAPAASDATPCSTCGADVPPGAAACPRCGESLAGGRALSRSEAIGMSEVMAVGEALARPTRSLDDTQPPFPTPWEEPTEDDEPSGEPEAAEIATTALEDELGPEAPDDASSPVAVARAAEEDSPPPRSPFLAVEEEEAAGEDAEESGEPGGPSPGISAAALYLPAAGFWVRAVAFAVDLTAPLVLALVVGLAAGGWRTPTGAVTGVAAGLVAWMALSIPFWSRRGASPGKRLLSLRVCDLDGRAGIGGRRAVLRFIGYLLGVLTLGVGFLLAGLSAERRGLHDRLAGSYVGRIEPSGRLL